MRSRIVLVAMIMAVMRIAFGAVLAMLLQLAGLLEIVALTGDRTQGHGGNQQGKQFHRRAV